MSISLVCLDLAGTTVRDDGAVSTAFDAALVAAGLEPGTPEHGDGMVHAQQTMGQSKIEVFRALLTEERAQLANEEFEKSYASSLADGGARAIDGAEQAIRELRESGVRVAFTTGFSPQTRDAVLAALGWTQLADLALSPADAGRGRPYPDLVLTALLRLEIDAVTEIAVVGDTANDLLSGHRAGAAVVAGVLTGAHGRPELTGVPHTHVLDSIADVPAVVTGR